MEKRQCAEVRKPKIIESFYHTILEEGLEGASIAKVAKRLNIHPTLILHYFGNKENMTLACVDFVIFEYAKLFRKLQSGNMEPEERLARLVKTLWSKAYYEKIHIAASLSVITVSFRNQRVLKKIKGLYRLFKDHLIKELKDLKEKGVIHVQDLERAADVLVTMVEGSRYFCHFFVKPKDLRQYNHDMGMAALDLLKNATWLKK